LDDVKRGKRLATVYEFHMDVMSDKCWGSCDELGGHIHVATVTPEEGFQWEIPPILPG
jgi:hypothetical protein